MSELLITYLADDLTGATDVLEQLTGAGVRTVLFFTAPDATTLARFPGVQAIGVAGTARSLGGEALDQEIRPALAALAEFRAPVCHYKVCSTFDSSPRRGNIGRALELGREVCRPALVAVLGGSPLLNRYCVFGNLFAAGAVAVDGSAYRLDRHPTASVHPATPMTESDLRRVLGEQTNLRIELFDVLQYRRSTDEQRALLARLQSGSAAVLFDVLEDSHLDCFAALIEDSASSAAPAFVVGSSGVETALCRRWSRAGLIPASAAWDEATLQQVLVGSGSCSPVTATQIDWAVRSGFAEVALDAPALVSAASTSGALDRACAAASEHLAAGRNVVVHAAKGPADGRIRATRAALGDAAGARSAEALGRAIGQLIDRCLEHSPRTRVCLAGGDTSSFAARELGIEALEMARPLSPGAPVCRVSAPGRAADRVEFTFKGGQVGAEPFFGQLAGGGR
ncbi:MAG: four-carbon acid sugar kinase family protein [Pirellulales bacterium]|nr:four-carbon acid sugar kinase family protein [Pirellulales bacterium]